MLYKKEKAAYIHLRFHCNSVARLFDFVAIFLATIKNFLELYLWFAKAIFLPDFCGYTPLFQ